MTEENVLVKSNENINENSDSPPGCVTLGKVIRCTADEATVSQAVLELSRVTPALGSTPRPASILQFYFRYADFTSYFDTFRYVNVWHE